MSNKRLPRPQARAHGCFPAPADCPAPCGSGRCALSIKRLPPPPAGLYRRVLSALLPKRAAGAAGAADAATTAAATAPQRLRILDLCSSWASHLGPDLARDLGLDPSDLEVIGHGANAEELAANPALSSWFVQVGSRGGARLRRSRARGSGLPRCASPSASARVLARAHTPDRCRPPALAAPAAAELAPAPP